MPHWFAGVHIEYLREGPGRIQLLLPQGWEEKNNSTVQMMIEKEVCLGGGGNGVNLNEKLPFWEDTGRIPRFPFV